jgi:hypothetical protein
LPCGFALSYPKISSFKIASHRQSVNFSIDFGKGGRSRIERTTSTHLPKDAEKACFAAGSYYSCLATHP